MKKAIILSGESMTGKTYRANAFKLFYKQDQITEIRWRGVLTTINIEKSKLVIIEGVPKKDIKMILKTLKSFKDVYFVITTQDHVNYKEFEDEYVINCAKLEI